MRRATTAALLIVFVLIGSASAAGADPPSPTDFRSEVIAVEPETSVVELGFIGGDNFIEMTVQPGHEVLVLGYRGEQYLLFEADGTVLENQRAPSTALNEDRYGQSVVPDEADAAAEPDWEEVGSGGYHAWHDHRTHWMNPSDPIGAEPGDQILEAVVPLRVDGDEVAVTVGSWWEPPPTPVATIIGMSVGLVLACLAGVRGQRTQCVLLVAMSTLLLAMGVVAYVSVPSVTGPDGTLWLFPLLAALPAVVALAVRDGEGPSRAPAARDALMVVSGVLLVWASWSRWDATTRAIVPSDAPVWLDRGVLGAALVVGGVSVLFVLGNRIWAARGRTTPAASPSSAS